MSHQRLIGEKLLRDLGLLNLPGLPTFEQFVHEWIPQNFLQHLFSLDGGQQGPASSAIVQLLYPILISLKVGNPILKVTPDLISSLRDTEIPDFQIRMLKTPFEAFRIEVPKNTFAAPAETVQEIHISNVSEDRFRVVFTHGEYSHYVSIDTNNPNETIASAINRTLDISKNKMPTELLQKIKKDSMYSDYFKADVFRFATNLALYITCPDADMYQDKTEQHLLHTQLQGMKAGHKRDKILNQLNQAKKQMIFIVGANVRLSKEYTANLTESGKSWTLKHRIRVMGHWKQQACGPKQSLRTLRWIAPYWKGPTYAEMLEKGYVIK